MNYTRGPWKPFVDGIWRVRSELPSHEDPAWKDWVCVISEQRDISKAEANAHLIAAAPELFEAAMELIGNIGNVGAHQCPGFDCARCQDSSIGWGRLSAAVNRARGKE